MSYSQGISRNPLWQMVFRGHFKMPLTREDYFMSTGTLNEKGTPQSRTYAVNDIGAILGIGRALGQ